MSSIATLSSVSFELPNGHLLLHNIHMSLNRNIIALVGPNGVGKTTLARLIADEIEPTEGSILRRGRVNFFRQREQAPPLPVADYLGFQEWNPLRERLLAPINRDSLCSHLSGGQWMRVRLSKAIDDSYLILDEPTNDLDRDGREAVFEFLRGVKTGCLLISHDRECLAFCDEVLELSNKGLNRFGGGWSAYAEARKQERDNLQENLDRAKRARDAAYIERKEQLEKQEKRNRRGKAAAARGGLPRILIGGRKRRAQVTTGKVDIATLACAEEAVRISYETYTDLKIDPIMYAQFAGQELPAQKLVAEARSFNVRYTDWVYPEDLNFVWRGNLRLALKGENGSGKSTLLKSLQSPALHTRGELRRGSLKTLLVDQKCEVLDDKKSVFENIRDISAATDAEIRNGLARFLFMSESVFQKVETLSGGERLRAALAKGFLGLETPELLILDEPTNNLDLINIEFLEKFLSSFRGAIIVISHDEVFLKNCRITDEYHVRAR